MVGVTVSIQWLLSATPAFSTGCSSLGKPICSSMVSSMGFSMGICSYSRSSLFSSSSLSFSCASCSFYFLIFSPSGIFFLPEIHFPSSATRLMCSAVPCCGHTGDDWHWLYSAQGKPSVSFHTAASPCCQCFCQYKHSIRCCLDKFYYLLHLFRANGSDTT